GRGSKEAAEEHGKPRYREAFFQYQGAGQGDKGRGSKEAAEEHEKPRYREAVFQYQGAGQADKGRGSKEAAEDHGKPRYREAVFQYQGEKQGTQAKRLGEATEEQKNPRQEEPVCRPPGSGKRKGGEDPKGSRVQMARPEPRRKEQRMGEEGEEGVRSPLGTERKGNKNNGESPDHNVLVLGVREATIRNTLHQEAANKGVNLQAPNTPRFGEEGFVDQGMLELIRYPKAQTVVIWTTPWEFLEEQEFLQAGRTIWTYGHKHTEVGEMIGKLKAVQAKIRREYPQMAVFIMVPYAVDITALYFLAEQKFQIPVAAALSQHQAQINNNMWELASE
ncbi:unnamed protein product, partial [Meganyctiphanes norvegica]